MHYVVNFIFIILSILSFSVCIFVLYICILLSIMCIILGSPFEHRLETFLPNKRPKPRQRDYPIIIIIFLGDLKSDVFNTLSSFFRTMPHFQTSGLVSILHGKLLATFAIFFSTAWLYHTLRWISTKTELTFCNTNHRLFY